MATKNLTLPANSSQNIDENDPANIHDGDTVNTTLGDNADLTFQSLDINLNVVSEGSTTIRATEEADLVVDNVTLSPVEDQDSALTFRLDNKSSITYNVNANSIDALENTTFHYMGSDEEGEDTIHDHDVGVIKIVAEASMLDSDGLNFSIENLQIGDKLLLEIHDENGVAITPDTYEFAHTPDGTTLFMLHDSQRLATINLPQGVEDDGSQTYSIAPDGTFVVSCYLRDTLITTPDGQQRIQDLQPGDTVLTANGRVATVKWVGHRKMYASRIPARHAIRAYPVRIAAGALGPDIPSRDLYVSPGHHMYFDGMLSPAMLLVNGKTITQDFSRRSFEYFHVELDRFDILLAEGAPAESYVDTGNRSTFQNVNPISLRADFGIAEGRPDIDGIEIVRNGPKLQALRKQLLQRAAVLTQSRRTKNPDLRLGINGRSLSPESDPASTDRKRSAERQEEFEGIARFTIPAGTQGHDLHILSRSAIVRETALPARRDLRRVGVGVARITITDDAGCRDIDLLDARLRGLQAVQDVHGIAMRWTSGDATIPATVHAINGAAVVELHIVRTHQYWRTAEKRAA